MPGTLITLRDEIIRLETAWGIAPIIVLSCGGYTDEHWQIWHPADRVMDGMPRYTWTDLGGLEPHPDATGS